MPNSTNRLNVRFQMNSFATRRPTSSSRKREAVVSEALCV